MDYKLWNGTLPPEAKPGSVLNISLAVEGAEDVLDGDFIPLSEATAKKGKTFPIKIIQPGWGSSGYYPAEVLERDGPAVFKKGTSMYWDHPTATEAVERPERSLRDLSGKLAKDAVYLADGPAGPGLYGESTLFAGFPEAVTELAPHIGVSIRALGTAKNGEAEGRKGRIVESIVKAQSVDFVTEPGAGGQVLQLFESKRAAPAIREPEVTEVDEKEAQQLRETQTTLTAEIATLKESNTAAAAKNAELETEVARLREGNLLREAQGVVIETLAGIEMQEPTRARLTASLSASPPIVDGALDKEAYVTAIKDAAKAEIEYLAGIVGSGRVKGLGESRTPDTSETDLAESFKEHYSRQGFTAEQADKLAAIAAAGR